MSGGAPSGVRFRRPTEADHGPIVRLVDEWWGGRRMSGLLQRMWFQHFTGTSWIAEDDAGRLLGFLIGFISPDDPEVGYVKMIATNPNRRRRGVRQVMAITWPGNRASVAFHRSVGFRLTDGPKTQNLYGSPAFADYDGDGEDRVLFIRELDRQDAPTDP
jgi:hypothetical protein